MCRNINVGDYSNSDHGIFSCKCYSLFLLILLFYFNKGYILVNFDFELSFVS